MKKIILCFFFLATSLFAENQKDIGRLPDGRAYRVDDQGYQLVDYVAELELRIEELQNKIIAINNEQKFQATKSEFGETNLMAEMQAKKVAEAACPSCECPEQIECPRAVLPECPQAVLPECPELPACPILTCPESESSCEDLEESYKLKLKQADRQILSLQENISEQANIISNYKLASNSNDSHQKALQQSQNQVANLQKRLVEKEQELREQESVVMAKVSDLTTQNKQLSEATNRISSLEQELQNTQRALNAKLSEPQPTIARSETSFDPMNSDTRNSAFEHLKTKLSGELSTYKLLLTKRNSLYRIYQGLPIRKTVSVSLSPTTTPDGFNAEKIEESILKATRFAELGAVQKNLFTLTKDARKDVAVLQRITQQ